MSEPVPVLAGPEAVDNKATAAAGMSKNALRRADFKTSLLLFCGALAMLLGAFTFPMTDSYGGVENAWYLSPALFPIMVASALMVLAVVLGVNAVRCGGAQDALAFLQIRGQRLGEREWRFLSIVGTICAYVYLYVPHVDFFLCTALFLLAFIGGFYSGPVAILKFNLRCFVAAGCAIWALASTGLAERLAGYYLVDIGIAAVMLGLFLRDYQLAGVELASRHRLRVALTVSLSVTLLLCVAFKYGLRVPLPTEGGVIALMEVFHYALRGMFGT